MSSASGTPQRFDLCLRRSCCPVPSLPGSSFAQALPPSLLPTDGAYHRAHCRGDSRGCSCCGLLRLVNVPGGGRMLRFWQWDFLGSLTNCVRFHCDRLVAMTVVIGRSVWGAVCELARRMRMILLCITCFRCAFADGQGSLVRRRGWSDRGFGRL
jgi:hypothetical protein